jgi:hypothetical protein
MIEVGSGQVTEVFTAFGQRGVRAEAVAEQAVGEARRYIAAGVPVGEHLADQLLIPLAMAGGGSYVTTEPTEHTRTNIEVVRMFLDVDVRVAQTGPAAWKVTVTGGEATDNPGRRHARECRHVIRAFRVTGVPPVRTGLEVKVLRMRPFQLLIRQHGRDARDTESRHMRWLSPCLPSARGGTCVPEPPAHFLQRSNTNRRHDNDPRQRRPTPRLASVSDAVAWMRAMPRRLALRPGA